jgi:hypothetical protein
MWSIIDINKYIRKGKVKKVVFCKGIYLAIYEGILLIKTCCFHQYLCCFNININVIKYIYIYNIHGT